MLVCWAGGGCLCGVNRGGVVHRLTRQRGDARPGGDGELYDAHGRASPA